MKDKQENKKQVNPYIVTTIIALLVGVGAFWGGMKYQQSKLNGLGVGGNRFGMNNNMQFGRGNGGGGIRGGFRPVSGQIISIDEKTLTVKLPDGSSKLVLLSDSTTYVKSNSGTKSDVTTGESVAVFGSENSDGSVTAQSIQLNPVMRIQDSGTSPSSSPKPSY